MARPIQLSSVYRCSSPDQAQQLLESQTGDYVYQRDAHPNADWFADACGQLHLADWTVVTSSGMAAIAAVALHVLQSGDHVLLSNRLYGRTVQLIAKQMDRLGITSEFVDACDLKDVASKLNDRTRLVIVETISNPTLRVVDIRQLSQLVEDHSAKLLIDNTFATPLLCQPLKLGADFVVESVSKIMNGHSDVMLGVACGHGDGANMRDVVSVWGLASAPFDCWLAERGFATFGLRTQQSCCNAKAIAEFLAVDDRAENVAYPGLKNHPDHSVSAAQFGDRFGYMISFDLPGGRAAVESFIAGSDIPFSPSLGEVCTTLSHPASTSHRQMSPVQATELGITEGTIRLSVGIEEETVLKQRIASGLANACK